MGLFRHDKGYIQMMSSILYSCQSQVLFLLLAYYYFLLSYTAELIFLLPSSVPMDPALFSLLNNALSSL